MFRRKKKCVSAKGVRTLEWEALLGMIVRKTSLRRRHLSKEEADFPDEISWGKSIWRREDKVQKP